MHLIYYSFAIGDDFDDDEMCDNQGEEEEVLNFSLKDYFII